MGAAVNRKNIPPAILAERKRQITAEGWTAAHDDEHVDGDLRIVAQAYYWHAIGSKALGWQEVPILKTSTRAVWRIPCPWPWAPKWWKPKTPERDLERAGALCIAEIERLQRRVDDGREIDEDGAAPDHIKDVERLLGRIIKAYNARAKPLKREEKPKRHQPPYRSARMTGRGGPT